MASFDWKSVIASVAPTLATMLGGPLAGTAVSAIAGAFGLSPDAGEGEITKVIQGGGMTPDIIAKIREQDQKHQELMAQQGIDLTKINQAHEEALAGMSVADVADARKANAGNPVVFNLAIVILLTFALMMGAVLYGTYQMLIGGITIKDVSVVAAISGLVGSVVGYVAANAQTVVNFIYGGSLGSEKKTDAMAAGITQAIGAATKVSKE